MELYTLVCPMSAYMKDKNLLKDTIIHVVYIFNGI
jgi:hypothetical protein